MVVRCFGKAETRVRFPAWAPIHKETLHIMSDSIAQPMLVISYPNPLLKEHSVEVTEFDEELVKLVARMKATMLKSVGVGLSAIQVGVPKRIFIMDSTSETNPTSVGPRTFVNPRIIGTFESLQRTYEGCLSFPGMFADLKRHPKIEVAAQDELGSPFTLMLEGIDAVCFQHELDHLNGITFYDRLSPLKQELFRKKMKKLG